MRKAICILGSDLFPTSSVAVGPWLKHYLASNSSPPLAFPIWSHLEPLQGLVIVSGTRAEPPKFSPSEVLDLIFVLAALQKMGDLPLDINIQEPRWDQSTFLGRARHFFTVTDPRNLLLSGDQLEASRNIVQNYR